MKKLFLISLLALSACSTPKLPEPTISQPKPPAVLMEPAENMKTIPTGT